MYPFLLEPWIIPTPMQKYIVYCRYDCAGTRRVHLQYNDEIDGTEQLTGTKCSYNCAVQNQMLI